DSGRGQSSWIGNGYPPPQSIIAVRGGEIMARSTGNEESVLRQRLLVDVRIRHVHGVGYHPGADSQRRSRNGFIAAGVNRDATRDHDRRRQGAVETYALGLQSRSCLDATFEEHAGGGYPPPGV